MGYSKRSFLKYLGSSSLITLLAVDVSVKSQNSEMIGGVLEDDTYRNNRRRNFKITSISTQKKVFSCSSISYQKYFVRFETLDGFTGEKSIWID